MKKVAFLLVLSLSLLSSPASAENLTTETGEPGVSIVRGSTINLVARESSVPVVVENTLPGEVRVIVHLRSNSPKVLISKSEVQLVLPAGTTENVKFPIQAIGSGSVVLVSWLTSLNGNEIGKRIPIKMVVNPDIETAAIVLFLSFVAVLIVIGVRRTLRRRRGV